MRADRLIQALLLLQGRASITASELAAELDVSVPTARRDLDALLAAGVPLYPQRGRGGGWRLIGGARTDLTGLTAVEAAALIGRLARAGGVTASEARAVRKVTQALPSTFRGAAERLAEATVVDAPWGRPAAQAPPGAVERLQEAVAAGRRIRFDYGGSERDLVPLVVGRRGAAWYLLAAPAGSDGETADVGGLRTFRVDRMQDLALTMHAGHAPAGFAPAEAWTRMVESVERARGAVEATVVVAAYAVDAVLDRFGVLGEHVAAEGDGREVVRVRAQDARALAEQLAGFHGAAEVRGPAEVRAELARIGAGLVRAYG